ncbi:polyphosphate polymerase domain-containing protein [Glutamicibacter sp. NPDC087344]|uniref:polyphosphate polymerase domain-containing protein n=1 Tax=Glutamicibacter sp. NPDC087344 TaxID=3363994 RepID=UPI00381ABF8B
MNWTQHLPSISLEELNESAALQTRVDRKYILSADQAQVLLPQLASGAQVLQIDELRSFNYSSVYFDTPELTSYHLAAHPRRRRFKIRTRSYLDTGACFLEVKTEGAREQTVKERIEHNLGERSTLNAESHDYVEQTLAHELGDCPIDVTELAPVLESSYRRTTLYRAETNSRVTVDENLVWADPRSGSLLHCNEVVLETKSALNAGEVDRLLWRHNVRPSRISKFATGLSLLQTHLPANRWHRTTKHKITTEFSLQD